MGLVRWLQPPRRTLTVFLGLVLLLGGALGLLGWQWLKQDRALERQRLQDGLELAADQMAAKLQQSLADLESYLSFVPGPAGPRPPDGIVVARATKGAFDSYPPDGLLFYPVLPDPEEPPAAAFAAGETLEFQRNDPVRAAAVFRELARSSDPGVRAGALLRLGRNLRKTGRNEEALRAVRRARPARPDLRLRTSGGAPGAGSGRHGARSARKARRAPKGSRPSARGPVERPMDARPARLGVSSGGSGTLAGADRSRPSASGTPFRSRSPRNRFTAYGRTSRKRKGAGSRSSRAGRC